MPDHETDRHPGAAEESPQTPAGRGSDVPPEQRGVVDEERTPDPQPLGDRAGGAGSAGGQVLESPGGPGTVDQEDKQDTTLAEELVEEKERHTGDLSPEMGTIRADPGAGGVRFDELVEKRKRGGLSDDEADELGRLRAEREGREWTSSRSLKAQPRDTA